jgi:hypothetical protein
MCEARVNLNEPEFDFLRLQFATSNADNAPGARALVLAEHGAIMASIVLNAPRATELSIYLVQAFTELRSMLATHREWPQKLHEPQNTLSALAAECGSWAFSGLKTQEGFAQN